MTDGQQNGQPEPGGVHNDLSGTAGNVAQFRDNYGGVHIYGDAHAPDNSKESHQESEGRQTRRSGKGSFWLLLIPIAIIAIIANSCQPDAASQSSGDQFPSAHGIRPPGSTNRAVLDAVSSKIRACAQAVVPQPANCPQSVDDETTTQASTVQWSLYGDPTEGAQVVWHDTAFYVRGVAIMTVIFTNDTTSNYSTPTPPLQVVWYQAVVTWKDNAATVDNLQKAAAVSGGIIRKHNPGVTQQQAADTLRQAFDQCQAATTEPMPPACPQPSAPLYDTSVTWHFQGDPVLNISQPSFDPSTGLIHVTGSYAATGHTTDLGLPYDYTQSGNYDAVLVEDSSTLRCLQIQSKQP